MKFQARILFFISLAFVFVTMVNARGNSSDEGFDQFKKEHPTPENSPDGEKTWFTSNFTIIAGDTIGLHYHKIFYPPQHIERIGMGDPVHLYLDVSGDGIDDVVFHCGNSYGAMGYANNYLTVTAVDSNFVCISRVDSSYCFNGYKPLYFTSLFVMNDTITDQLQYTQNENIIDKELWSMGDTCTFWVENTGLKYVALRIKSGAIEGLAWVKLELFPLGFNGFSANIVETGFKTQVNSIPEDITGEVTVYPNPSDGVFNIEIPGIQANFTAEIFDAVGREIISMNPTSKLTQIRLDKGVYLLKLTRKNQNFVIKKIIVR